jgi:hypothetical protein
VEGKWLILEKIKILWKGKGQFLKNKDAVEGKELTLEKKVLWKG